MPFLTPACPPLTNKSFSRPHFPFQSPHAPFLSTHNSLHLFVSSLHGFRVSDSLVPLSILQYHSLVKLLPGLRLITEALLLQQALSDGQSFRQSELHSSLESGLSSLIILDPVIETACRTFDKGNWHWMRMIVAPKLRQTLLWHITGSSSYTACFPDEDEAQKILRRRFRFALILWRPSSRQL